MICAVVAETKEAALNAAKAVKIEYEDLPLITTIEVSTMMIRSLLSVIVRVSVVLKRTVVLVDIDSSVDGICIRLIAAVVGQLSHDVIGC